MAFFALSSMNKESTKQNYSIPSNQSNRHLRKICSFVLREGRLTKGQERAMQNLWPVIGHCIADGQLNTDIVFQRNNAPTVLEIGFCMGDSLAIMAQKEPEKNFIGIEVHTPGVGALLIQIEKYQLTNIHVYNEDAIEVLNRCIADNSLERIQIYFPDPWQKRRHHKRRIIQPEFIQLIQRKLMLNGKLHLATDWQDYAKHMLNIMSAADGFKNLSPDNHYIHRPEWRPMTKFEQRGLKLGHGVWDLLFEKIS